MKKSLIFLLVIASLVSGCSFNVEILTPAAPQPVLQSASETPTSEPISATPSPGIISLPSQFDDVSFTLNPIDAGNIYAFPNGTKQVFAIWNYHNMGEGMVVRREWYLDGKLWLEREEPWDFAKYGANGTMRDVSIHEHPELIDPRGKPHVKIVDGNIAHGPVFTIFSKVPRFLPLQP